MGTTEQTLRKKLGVTADARTVLVFGETSHWDPNWLLTAGYTIAGVTRIDGMFFAGTDYRLP